MAKIDIKLAEKVALSCNILAMYGHDEFTLGHVSARKSGQAYMHMKPRGLGLDEVTPQDIIVLDLEGNKLAGSTHRHLEYPIHTEIYRMYPHVNCVIHTHPFYSIIIASSGDTIRDMSYEGSLFAGIPVFSETTMLIESPETGRAIAGCLKGQRALLMRKHGITVTGTSVEEATVDALLLEKAAKFQVMASRAGLLVQDASNETLRKREQLFSKRNFMASWNYCARKLKK